MHSSGADGTENVADLLWANAAHGTTVAPCTFVVAWHDVTASLARQSGLVSTAARAELTSTPGGWPTWEPLSRSSPSWTGGWRLRL